MPYPVAKVSIAFDDGPYVLSPTWTDITSSVRSMSVDRGRFDDWGTFSGSANVVLNNRTRLFDPYFTSGTYYGKLLPRRQIKIEAVWNGGTYAVFRGFVDGWPASWTDAGGDSTVTLSCYDCMQLLAQVQLPADWSRNYILSLLPRHYFPCDDPIVSFTTGTLTDNGFFPKNGTYNTRASSGTQLATGLVNRSLAGIALDATGVATNSAGPFSDPVAFTANEDFTVAFWVAPDEAGSTILEGQTGNFGFAVYFSAGKFSIAVGSYGPQQSYSYTTTGEKINNSTPVHFALVWTASTLTAQIFVNGVNVTGTKSTASAIILYTNTDYVTVLCGPVQQILMYSYKLTQANIQTIIQYSQASFIETTGARQNRIIAETPFSSSLVVSSGTQQIAEITDDAPYAMAELQLTANTEGAPIYATKAGVLKQMSTYEQFTQANSFTSQQTYGSGGLGLGQDITMQPDGDSMRNAINVTMTGGGVIKSSGSVSSSIYGQATQTWDAYTATVSQATTIGSMLVGLGQYVFPRFEDFQVVVSPSASWASTLNLELLERITVAVAPPTGNVITQSMLVNRIRHEVQPGLWQTYLNGSVRWGSAFRLDQSILDGPDVILYTAS